MILKILILGLIKFTFSWVKYETMKIQIIKFNNCGVGIPRILQQKNLKPISV